LSSRKKKAGHAPKAPRARNAPSRQRQRLIDACISALHTYGPSRTTVEKVVAIAKMSPGIVRFYFDSKAAMLVASLQFLAAEFEERLMVPVARLKSNPVKALDLMVDLYLDPEIASSRKVSVWYSFWGEASSRQEYYDICGQKDESFAALVRDLIERLIIDTRQPQLDPDGIALGLIGVLEMLWQDFAFQTEENIDRLAAKRRCMAYLRSIFPGQFASAPLHAAHAGPAAATRLPAWVYDSPRLYAAEREAVFQGSWQLAGHELQIARPGDFIAIDTASERALIVRDATGAVRAFRNSCGELPHVLVPEGRGHLAEGIACEFHGLKFSLDGRRLAGAGAADLIGLDLLLRGGLIFVRSLQRAPGAAPSPGAWVAVHLPHAMRPLGSAREAAIAADWKLIVEQWLTQANTQRESTASGWAARLYRHLAGVTGTLQWKRQFVWPNHWVESRADGLSILQVMPTAPGRCLLRRFDYTVCAEKRAAHSAAHLAARVSPISRRATLGLAESAQNGIALLGYERAQSASIPQEIAAFRRQLAEALPTLALEGRRGD
jgi:TetR/AcrR family transcriptional regulator, transcriptional repressor of bet genes